MATTILTITNSSGSEKIYGGQRVANSASFVVSDGDRTQLLEDDTQFGPDLTAGNAVVDNGVFNLSESVALRALRSEQAVITPSWHAAGDVTVGSFLKEMQLPPGVGEYKASFTGYISGAVTSQLGVLAFEVEILINDVAQATIVVPAAGSTQESVVTALSIPIVQEDSVSITVSSGAPEDPIVRLTLQDW